MKGSSHGNKMDNMLEELGYRIRLRRLALGMSQEELAQKTGYNSRSSINKIELGETDLPCSKLLLVAKALGVRPSYLINLENEIGLAEEDEPERGASLFRNGQKATYVLTENQFELAAHFFEMCDRQNLKSDV